MKRRVCLAVAAVAALVVSVDVLASTRIARVYIIDRDTGAQLTPHLYRGEYWVAGTPGAHYAIEIRNLLSERLLAVTSVDGVNVISGTTAGWDQTGYVFDPGERYQITGWRKSDAEVAAFTFTDSSASYAQRTGRPANIGVIGVALFRERQPAQVFSPLDFPDFKESTVAPQAGLEQDGASARQRAPSNSVADAASRAESAAPAQALPAPKLGTGHGEREASYINHTDFNRLQSEPNEVIRIHYDSLNNLVAMGIVKRPRREPPTPNPFPASPDQQYAADPPG